MPSVGNVAESERPGLIDPERLKGAAMPLTAVISEEVLLTLAF